MPRAKTTKTEELKKEPKIKSQSFYAATGRRKTAIASVKLQVGGEGKIIVNKLPVEQYFSGEVAKKSYLAPLEATNNLNRFDIFVRVVGSGKAAQLSAVVHGISRALNSADKDQYHTILKKHGFLTRDPRARERRKAGQAGRARAKKQSPKR
ncbi:30S ribosomal protein S9 [Candidatus Microgenomates bacterium]|nr:30S ribosomal protein S9 [Candidatus Microgenomates bacterium]